MAVAYLAASWLLIQVLETLFPIFGLSETAIRVIVIMLSIGLVPAVTLAWIFEWTPDGLRRDSEVPRNEPRTSGSRKFDRVIIALLTVAVVFFAVDRFVIHSADDSDDLLRAEEIVRE